MNDETLPDKPSDEPEPKPEGEGAGNGGELPPEKPTPDNAND